MAISILIRARRLTAQTARRFGMPPDWFLIPLGALIGVLAGVVAVGFHKLVAASETFFLGNIHAQSLTTGQLLLLLFTPAVGGLAVGLIQHYIQHAPPSHGIPDIIESLARKQGVLRTRAGVYTAIKSSLTLGSGGSTGVEGPIVFIGAVLGSLTGRRLRVSRTHMGTLIGCGAAAGLAALFNAPIAAVIFVLEVLLRDFSLRTFMPIVVASVFGTAVAQPLLDGDQAVFGLPRALSSYSFSITSIWLYVFLGILCGIAARVYSLALTHSEEWWDHAPIHPALRPAAGGMSLGLLGILFVVLFSNPIPGYEGPPAFFGNGYNVVIALLSPDSYAPLNLASQAAASPHSSVMAVHVGLLVLAAVFFLKLGGTALSLGSGGAGGIFAPSLFLGASLGGFVGILAQSIFHLHDFTPATCALAGMAGVLAGAVHCPFTAFLLVFEITRDYKIILPVMLVSILGTFVAALLNRDHLYAGILRQRGIIVGSFSDLTLLRKLHVGAVPFHPNVDLPADLPVKELIDRAAASHATDYTVCDAQGRYVGIVTSDTLVTILLSPESIPLMIASDLIHRDVPALRREDTLEKALDAFSRHEVASLAIVDSNQRPVGLITRTGLMRFYQAALSN